MFLGSASGRSPEWRSWWSCSFGYELNAELSFLSNKQALMHTELAVSGASSRRNDRTGALKVFICEQGFTWRDLSSA